MLTSPILSSPSVPFYCRRFRGNCSVRRDNICCREENIATTEAVTEEKSNSSANENITNITKPHSELEETLLSSASIIDEVVVAPDEPPVSLSQPQSPSKLFCISGSSELDHNFYNNNQARQVSPKILQATKI